MPYGTGDFVQSAFVQDKLYVGGGYTGSGRGNIVLEYDISSAKWARLLPYKSRDFAMAAIQNQLVLAGGYEHGSRLRLLGVWRADEEEWTHPYPEMPTARSQGSAVGYQDWLVVAGGWSGSRNLSCVEILNVVQKQWYAGPTSPQPWCYMHTALLGDHCYFMGGFTGTGLGSNTEKVYRLSLSAVTSELLSNTSGREDSRLWKEISGLPSMCSTPLSISGSLLAVGGRDMKGHAVSAIHLYHPDTGEWAKMGDLPTPRYNCTCAVIADKEVLVAGGTGAGDNRLKRVDITSF